LLWQTFIGLLASTGLRVGEARRLTVDDVVLDGNPPHLRIVETKFRKSRLVPVHPTTADRLRHYAWHRCHLGYQGVSEVFFPSATGAVLHRATVGHVFHRLTQQLGIPPRAGGQTPTLQSLQHTFAVERLRLWYRAGLDVQALLPHLSVYLGHLRPQDTYWYLTATPELLTLAADRFQHYADAEGGRA
jgi:integrase